jgi:hypothetical protein
MSDTPSLVTVGLERIDPERLALVLQESGWKVAGQRSGMYVRLRPPEEERYSVLVPLDREAPDYGESMRAALADIDRLVAQDISTSNIPARLIVEPSDSFRFRAESAAPIGLIAWTQGERLITSARKVLVAGSKTHIEHLKYYGNRLGQFANRYLDTVLMGQTAPGSYVVTAFAPASGFVPLSVSSIGTPPMFELDSDITSTRSIGLSVMRAAEATKEAVEHYRERGSLSGFEELVSSGVSYEMTVALSGLVEGSDGADISVEWDPELEPPADRPSTHIEILPSDLDVLTRASSHLAASAAPPQRVTIMGRVHLLTQREAGGPGVIGIENLSPDRPKKLRVHLTDEDYHRALRAHDDNRAVLVEGQMEREGNIYWVYDGRLLEVLAPVEEIRNQIQARSVEQIPGQMELDVDEFGSE